MEEEEMISEKQSAYEGKVVEFEERYKIQPAPPLPKLAVARGYFRRRCTRERMKRFANRSFPFVKNLRKYEFRKDIANDIIAGFTVGIMQIPQGMAYALLSSLPPICGLYISFFSPLVYFCLGTSKHASMGCIAIVSLMIGSVIESSKISTTYQDDTVGTNVTVLNISSNGSFGQGELDAYEPHGIQAASDVIELAAAVSLISGFLMILFGRLGLGFITTYMPEPMVSGFTSAVAIHVTTSQAKHILGLGIKRQTGIFKIIKTWRDIFLHIHETNYIPVVMSIVCMVILYLVKIHINQRFKDKLKIPVPIEIIVVILATTASHFGNFHRLSILKDIPAGLPLPSIPNPTVASGYLKDAFVIGIVAFTQSVSMAKILARKNNYSIDPNQEMVAYGASSVVCSLFLGYIPAASVARSMVQDGAGGKTQVASLFGSLVVLIVILAVGPLFYSLPKCVLSSVILVNLRGMFLQFLELKPLFKKSKFDFIIWVVTFCATVLLDADIGIAVGIVFSVFTVAIRTQRTTGYQAVYIDETNILKDASLYSHISKDSVHKIIQFHSPVYFANADRFITYVYRSSGIDPYKVKKKRKRKFNDALNKHSKEDVGVTANVVMDNKENGELTILNEKGDTDIISTVIILDFRGVSFVDVVGIKAIRRIMSEFKEIDVTVYIAECNDNVISTFRTTDLLHEKEEYIYTTVTAVIQQVAK